jgi:hypothetical protein
LRVRTKLGAVHAGGGQPRRRQQPVDLVDLAAGENRHGAVEPPLQRTKGRAQAGRRRHVRWHGRDIKQRPVQIEKQGDVSWLLDPQCQHSRLLFRAHIIGAIRHKIPPVLDRQ